MVDLSMSDDFIPVLLKALRSGSLDLVEYLMGLIERLNERDRSIKAFLPETERSSRLIGEAQTLVERFPDPEKRPGLFGLPFAVKDIFHIQGFPTHGGSRLPSEVLKGNESVCVSSLKEAGALILGKTVTTEFAYFVPGPTRNPHNLDHTPGGSSSGSAAAVAAGMVPLALGTQTIGSVNRPAAFCGVVGYKPSYDRISREGVIPLSPSLDHVGFFTPDVPSAEFVASFLLTDWKPYPPNTLPVLGVPTGPYLEHASREGLDHFEQVRGRLEASGYRVLSIPAMADIEEIIARHNRIVAAESAQVHQLWFGQFEELYHPKTAELIRRGQQVSERSLKEALESRLALRRRLMELMEEHGVDLWISPASPGAAPAGIESTGDPVMNLPWTHSGFPALSVPSGTTPEGLPLGLQLTGKWFEDEKLLDWGIGIEGALEAEMPTTAPSMRDVGR